MIKTIKDLQIYKISYNLAMEIYKITKTFPKEEEEVYSLTDQIRRSSRSIPANIAEGWAKRKYENVFIKYLNDAMGSCEEVKVWLDFAKDCNYINNNTHEKFYEKYNQIGAMLFSLIKKWKKF